MKPGSGAVAACDRPCRRSDGTSLHFDFSGASVLIFRGYTFLQNENEGFGVRWTKATKEPCGFQLYVRKAPQHLSGIPSGTQTWSGLDRSSQDSRTPSVMSADEWSRGAGTQPVLPLGAG